MENNNTAHGFELETESYSLVSTETLENAFPTIPEEAVEVSPEAAPPRSRAEKERLGKTLFFKKRK